MPRKPKHPCSFPGCPNLVEHGQRYCEEHQRLENKRYERYDRDPAVRKRYGRAWKRIRDSYAAAHPLCEECLKHGVYDAAGSTKAASAVFNKAYKGVGMLLIV